MGRAVEKLLCETRQVFQVLAETSDEVLRSRGLSAHEQGVLQVLARKPRPVSTAALARAMLATVRDTHLAVAALRERGWIDCQAGPPDSRGGTVALNPLGHACWVDLRAGERVLLERLTANLDERAVHSTFATLRAVRRLLQRSPRHIRQPTPCGV